MHEIAQAVDPDSRVAYVDIDPVAVLESLEILEGNENATAIRADARDPRAPLDHTWVRSLLDFDQPAGVLLAVLHFVPDDDEARGAVYTLLAAVLSGSYLVISHAAQPDENVELITDVYRRQTTRQLRLGSRGEITAFFDGLELVEPGVVWSPQWLPEPEDPTHFNDNQALPIGLCGVARKP